MPRSVTAVFQKAVDGADFRPRFHLPEPVPVRGPKVVFHQVQRLDGRQAGDNDRGFVRRAIFTGKHLIFNACDFLIAANVQSFGERIYERFSPAPQAPGTLSVRGKNMLQLILRAGV